MSRNAGNGENGESGKKKKIASGLVKISVANGPIESGDFSENGIFGENGEYGKHLPKS